MLQVNAPPMHDLNKCCVLEQYLTNYVRAIFKPVVLKNYRTYNHRLSVETGRYANIERQQLKGVLL